MYHSDSGSEEELTEDHENEKATADYDNERTTKDYGNDTPIQCITPKSVTSHTESYMSPQSWQLADNASIIFSIIESGHY